MQIGSPAVVLEPDQRATGPLDHEVADRAHLTCLCDRVQARPDLGGVVDGVGVEQTEPGQVRAIGCAVVVAEQLVARADGETRRTLFDCATNTGAFDPDQVLANQPLMSVRPASHH